MAEATAERGMARPSAAPPASAGVSTMPVITRQLAGERRPARSCDFAHDGEGGHDPRDDEAASQPRVRHVEEAHQRNRDDADSDDDEDDADGEPDVEQAEGTLGLPLGPHELCLCGAEPPLAGEPIEALGWHGEGPRLRAGVRRAPQVVDLIGGQRAPPHELFEVANVDFDVRSVAVVISHAARPFRP